MVFMFKHINGKLMILTTIDTIPGKQITGHFGIVHGSTVRAKHAGKDIMAGFKNFFGGELSSYTELLEEAREEAIARMKKQAISAGANAVVNIRMATSAVSAGAAEVYVYGTAVIAE